MDTQKIAGSFAQNLQKGATARTVYGEPVAVDGRTVIPVARVSYGFGAGSGTNVHEGVSDEGSGGGGGLSARPVGVVEIAQGGTRFIAFSDGRKLLAAAAAGFLIGVLLGRRS